MRQGVRVLLAVALLIVLAACGGTADDVRVATSRLSITTAASTSTTTSTLVVTDTTVTVTTVPTTPVTAAPIEKALLVGDSTLLGVKKYVAFDAFRGFAADYQAASCRTLGVPSCGDPPISPNALETIRATTNAFDALVIMAGYDEWWTTFPKSFGEVIDAARAKGARYIIWLTYQEGVAYKVPDGRGANEAFVKNNATLRAMVATGSYPDVVIADWDHYTTTVPTWMGKDGIHLTREGAYGVADYISRFIEHLSGRPCPVPLTKGGAIETPCPSPDETGPPLNVVGLYT